MPVLWASDMALAEEIDHGTYAGAQEHRARGEKPCDFCRIAKNEYMNNWRRNRSNTVMVYRVGTWMERVTEDGRDRGPVWSQTFSTQNAVDEYLDEVFLAETYEWLIVWVEEAAEPNWRPL